MEEKVCTSCGETYPADTIHFRVESRRSSGLAGHCRFCCRKKAQDYKARNREQILQRNRTRYAANKESILQKQREARRSNPEKYRRQDRERRLANLEYHRRRDNQYRAANANYLNAKRSQRYKRNPVCQLNNVMRAQIHASIKGGKNGYRWETLTGYTVEELKSHLEQQFQRGMTWENYGKDGWHIDHIKPISHFNFESPEDPGFKECWSLWNLRPLWGKENISRGNRVTKHPLPLLPGGGD